MNAATLCVCGIALSSRALAQPGLWLIEPPPGMARASCAAVSADGLVVTGTVMTPALQPIAMRWTTDAGVVMFGPVPSTAAAISDDGSTIVGWSGTGTGSRAFRWTMVEGMTYLGETVPGGHTYQATDTSADGSTVIGYCAVPESPYSRPFVWTRATGMVPMDILGQAHRITPDGLVIAGGRGIDAFRFDGALTLLSGYPCGYGYDAVQIRGMSTDGSVIVGRAAAYAPPSSIPPPIPFRWTPARGCRTLPSLHLCEPTAISSDGAIIGANSWEACVLVPGMGRLTVFSVLTAAGIPTVDARFTHLTGLSANARTIVGNDAAAGRGWYARLPEGSLCFANCDGSTAPPVLDTADVACFLNRFFAGDSRANCDESTAAPILNIADFTCFLNRFAGGCP